MKIFKLIIIFFVSAYNLAFGQTKNWVPLPQEVNDYVGSLNTYKGLLIAGGGFSKVGQKSFNSIASWDGMKWAPLGNGLKTKIWSPYVYCMLSTDSVLYVGGEFDSAGSVNAKNLAKWNGKTWSSLGTGANGKIFSIVVYKNEIYVGGVFDSIGGIKANRIAKWDGISWQPLGNGMNKGIVLDLCIYQNELYTLGNFDSVGNISCNNIARWNGAVWKNVSFGVDNSNAAMINWKGKLLIGSSKTFKIPPDTNDEIKQWDGNNIETFSIQNEIRVRDFFIFNNDLYCSGGGGPARTDRFSFVFKWDTVNSKWISIGQGPNKMVAAMAEYKGELYCGGDFNSNEYSNLNFIGRLADVSAINSDTDRTKIEIFPNPFKNALSIVGLNIDKIIIINSNGNIVKQVESHQVNNTIIETEFITNGFYIIEIVLKDGNVFRRKIVKI